MKGKRQAELSLAVVPVIAHVAITIVMAAGVAAAVFAAYEVVAVVPEGVEVSLDVAEE